MQPPVGVCHGGQDPEVGVQGGLDGGLDVPGEDDGAAHVHGEDFLLVVRHRGGDEALEGEDFPDVGHRGLQWAVEGVGELLPQGACEHLGQQQLAQIQLGEALGDVDAADDQHPPAGLPADEGAELGVAQP